MIDLSLKIWTQAFEIEQLKAIYQNSDFKNHIFEIEFLDMYRILKREISGSFNPMFFKKFVESSINYSNTYLIAMNPWVKNKIKSYKKYNLVLYKRLSSDIGIIVLKKRQIRKVKC